MVAETSPESRVGNFVFTIIFILFLQFAIPIVFDFLDVDASVYQIYLYWIMALLIFYMILPVSVGDYIFLPHASS
jgi:hypothetical protein